MGKTQSKVKHGTIAAELATDYSLPDTSVRKIVPDLSHEDLNRRKTKIAKDILLRKGEFGSFEAHLIAAMFISHFSHTPNHTSAYKKFKKELNLVKAYDRKNNRDVSYLIETLTEEDIKLYAEMAYTNTAPF